MLTKIKNYFLTGESSAVFKGMWTLLVGAGLARIIGVISIPILARIYTPENYGVLALYVSFVAILTPIMTLRYVQAIPLPKTDVMAFNLFSVCFKLIVFFSILIALVLAFFGDVVLGWFNMEALIPWRWLIVLGVAGSASYELFSLWATRKRQYKVIAKTQFTQSLIGNLTKIGLGLLSYKASGMLIGQLLSQSAGITSYIKTAREDFKNYLPKVERSKEKIVAKYYQDFFWYRLPSQFLMVLSVQAPVMIMAAMYGKEVAGQLSLAMMALSLPIGLIGSAISKAYYAEIANLGQRNLAEIRRVTLLVQKKLCLIGLPIALCLYFFSESAFYLVFGDNWKVAGEYASILSFNMFFSFVSAPLVQVLNVTKSQRAFLLINVFRCALVFSSFFVSFYSGGGAIVFLTVYSFFISLFFILVSVYILVSLDVRGG